MSEPEVRSPLSAGLVWASRVSALGLYFALPAVLGGYADRKLGSGPAGILIGMIVGFTAGMVQVLRMARGGPKSG